MNIKEQPETGNNYRLEKLFRKTLRQKKKSYTKEERQQKKDTYTVGFGTRDHKPSQTEKQ